MSTDPRNRHGSGTDAQPHRHQPPFDRTDTAPRAEAPIARGQEAIVEAVALGHGPDAVTRILEILPAEGDTADGRPLSLTDDPRPKTADGTVDSPGEPRIAPSSADDSPANQPEDHPPAAPAPAPLPPADGPPAQLPPADGPPALLPPADGPPAVHASLNPVPPDHNAPDHDAPNNPATPPESTRTPTDDVHTAPPPHPDAPTPPSASPPPPPATEPTNATDGQTPIDESTPHEHTSDATPHDGGNYVVLVSGLLPGERARVQMVSSARKHGRGRLVKRLTTSPGRVEPRCPHVERCGRCDRQHIAEDLQRELLGTTTRESLPRMLGRDDLVIADAAAPPSGYGQRLSLYLHVRGTRGELELGFLRRNGEEFVPVEQCRLHHPLAFELATAARRAAEAEGLPAWNPENDSGLLRGIHVRVSSSDGGLPKRGRAAAPVDPRFADMDGAAAERIGRAQVTWVMRRDSLRNEEPLVEAVRAAGASGVTLAVNEGPPGRPFGRQFRHLSGDRVVLDTIGGITYRVSADGHMPATAFGSRVLVDAVRRLTTASRQGTVVDVFCGSGALSLAVAGQVGRVIGLDAGRSAVDDARRTAREHRLVHAAFRAGWPPKLVSVLADEGVRAETVLVQPPPEGAGELLLKTIARGLKARQILYVAPSLQVLADEGRFMERGPFRIDRIEPVDLTPLRHGVQAVVSFVRR